MCRNIKPLYNFAPPANDEEIKAAAVQFVRKISGFNKPSAVNAEAFDAAVEAITSVSQKLLDSLYKCAAERSQNRTREVRERNLIRFGRHKVSKFNIINAVKINFQKIIKVI